MSESLHDELKQLIVGLCNISLPPEWIDVDAPLIGPQSPLGLDSLDAVEIVVGIQKKYGVRIGGKESVTRVMRSLGSLARYIEKHRVLPS